MLTAGTLPRRAGAGAGAAAAEPAKILETTRFGNRVGETRWEINKAAVLEYYREMMDNPERLAGLFNAMEPDRDVEGKVAGYRLNVARGEKDFYVQVGLRDGDVVPACAQTCPTQAIVFGDLNDPQSRVARLQQSPRAYSTLAELNAKPRTAYLARLRNPGGPEGVPGGLAPGSPGGHGAPGEHGASGEHGGRHDG